MILIREILLDAAREIVEGRRTLPTVRTVPYVASRPVARAPVVEEPAPVPGEEHRDRRCGYKHSAIRIHDLVVRYRDQNPGKFTSAECATWCQSHGYENGALASTRTKLRALKVAGVVKYAGFRQVKGVKRPSQLWQFTQTK